MTIMEKRPKQLVFICILLITASLIHFLIIFGVFKEEGLLPLISWYFNSLSLVNIIAAYGIWNFRKWGRVIVLLIAITQIASHSYLLLKLGTYQLPARIIDIAFAIYFLVYFNSKNIKKKFE